MAYQPGTRLLSPSGKQLEEARVNACFTRREIADLLGYSHQFIYAVEREDRSIDPVAAWRWMKSCGVDAPDPMPLLL